MPRGIVNPTGTACHLSSAILLTYYCLEPLAQSLTWDNHDDVSFYLASVWTQLEDNESTSIDPTLLYRAIQKTLHVQAHDLGDAVTSWCRLMQHCRSCLAWDETVGGGQVHSVLRGYQQDNKQQQEQPNFIKSLPIRPMPVPYSVVLDDNNVDCSTLVQALENSLEPRIVQGGYQWRPQQQQQQQQQPTETDDCATQTITTTKTLYWDSLPKYWMIHLDRRQQRSNATCDIPRFLDPTTITSCSLSSESSYELQGAILHVTTIDNNEEEDGHYLTLIRQPSRHHCHEESSDPPITNDHDNTTDGNDDQWYCLDDDLVRTVSSTALALQLCTGCPMPVEWSDDHDDDDKLWACGFLLVYRSKGNNSDIGKTFVRTNDTDNTGTDIKHNGVDWTRPYTLVGRRLKVLWTKGQWYPGVVAEYHASTGQHEVRYTDGDVKRYQLRKKTIEWLE